MDFYKGTIPIIPEGTKGDDMLFPQGASYGAVPRDYSVQPAEMFAAPSEMDVYPESDWDALYDEQEAQQSSLEHLYLGNNGQPVFDNLKQGSDGYCWFYSTGHAMMLKRLAMGQPIVRLNPHSGAAIIKRGRNEGGWGGLSAQFVRENGIAEEGTGPGQWPARSRDLRYDTAECRKLMAKYKSTEEWVDIAQSVYDQNMSRLQLATAMFQNDPGPLDFSWWAHSVCGLRWVRISRGNWGPLILNSWPADWGRFNLAVLEGNRGRPDGALSIRQAKAA